MTARRRKLLQGLLSVAVVGGVFVGVLPKVADLQGVWATIAAMTWLELATLSAVALWNLASYWIVLLAVLPGLSLRRAAAVNLVGGAVSNTVPGGGALAVGTTYAMLSSWGFERGAIALSVLVSGIWNTFIKLGLPILPLVLLVIGGRASMSLAVGALVGAGALAVAVGAYALMLRSPVLAERMGTQLGRVVSRLRRMLRRPPVQGWGDASVRFRSQIIGLVRTRWQVITVASVCSHLALYLVLLLTLRHVGVSESDVGWVAVLGTFAFVRLLSALPITPGGLGVVELGLGAALVLAGGQREQVVAAVLVYRALTYLPTIPLGAAAYLLWRRSVRNREAPADAPLVQVPLAAEGGTP